MRTLAGILVAVLLGFGVAFVAAGFRAGPAIDIAAPAKYVGLATPVEAVVTAPGGTLSSLSIVFVQNGVETPIFTFDGRAGDALISDGTDRVRVARPVGREQVPSIASGPARLVVRASRPVFFGLRDLSAESVRDVEVRLDRPRVSALSTHHYVNLGGAEMVLYRVSPADVASGVMVGDLEYPGFPASGVTVEGIQIADPAVRVAFFALRYDQPLSTPMHLFARDEAGNTGRGDFDYRTFPKTFKQSRIEVTEALLTRVVPAILATTADFKPAGSPIEQFVAINSDLRRRNAEQIAAFARQTAPELYWRGVVFHPFGNTSAESAFADHRTYTYQGREVDRQVHLGFDLASVARAPIVAANRGKVLFAGDLGIYGQCVIVDHGMGVQSLYAHLSSMAVAPGTMVEKGQELGRSGVTGMAGGDHLHFTMLVSGQMVNPIEWWDAPWIQDRILRKLRTPW
jgi:murein DD-endopeptidase MepM/ murein hydrolase activator NlpD